MIVNLGSVQLLATSTAWGSRSNAMSRLRGQLFKNATRMTSAPECSVDVQSVRVSHKRLRRLLAQNRQMNECLAHARNSQTMEAEPTAPPRKFFTIRTRSPPHQARPRAPRVHAPQAASVPQLEVLAHADQRNLPVEAAHLPEFGGNQNPACTVRLQIDGAAENIAHEARAEYGSFASALRFSSQTVPDTTPDSVGCLVTVTFPAHETARAPDALQASTGVPSDPMTRAKCLETPSVLPQPAVSFAARACGPQRISPLFPTSAVSL